MKFNSIFAISKQINGNPPTNRKLIRREAKIGGKLFGPVPKGHTREFFCLDDRTWVWYEEWNDENSKLHHSTTRYEIYPDKIMKVQNGEFYPLGREEAVNLYKAAQIYNQRIRTELYTQVS